MPGVLSNGKPGAGEALIPQYGTPLPQYVLDSIRKQVALKGPLTTPRKGIRSVNVTLRQELTFATCARLKPAGVETRYSGWT